MTGLLSPKFIAPVAAVLTLSACDTPIGTEIARDQAKGVVDNVVQDKLPGVDVSPVSDCVIDNASGSEILSIAGAAVTGISESTVELVFDIARREGTIKCFANTLGPLLIAQIAAAG